MSSAQNILFQIYRIPSSFLIIRTFGCIYGCFWTRYNPPWKFRRTMFESSRPCNICMRKRQFFIKKGTKRPRNNIFSQKWMFSFRFWKAESFWLYRGGIQNLSKLHIAEDQACFLSGKRQPDERFLTAIVIPSSAMRFVTTISTMLSKKGLRF